MKKGNYKEGIVRREKILKKLQEQAKDRPKATRKEKLWGVTMPKSIDILRDGYIPKHIKNKKDSRCLDIDEAIRRLKKKNEQR